MPSTNEDVMQAPPAKLSAIHKIKLGIIIVTGIGVSYIVDDIIASNKQGNRGPLKRICMSLGSLAIGLYVSDKVSMYAGETFVSVANWATKVVADVKENTQGVKS